MRILIVSDTHRKAANLIKVMEKEGEFDLALHLGDLEMDEPDVRRIVKCPFVAVAGNNDYYGNLPREKEIMIGRNRVLMVHGHNYYVSLDANLLAAEASLRGCHIAMYGHTHRPKIETKHGVLLMNPGSLSYPRQDGRKPSYIVMDEDKGNLRYEIRYLEEK